MTKKTIEKYLGWRDHNLSKWTKLRNEVKKTGVAKVNLMGYDDYYLVPVGKLRDEGEELQIDNDWSAAKIKNAFAKNLTQRFGNKVRCAPTIVCESSTEVPCSNLISSILQRHQNIARFTR